METNTIQYQDYTAWNPKQYLAEYYSSIMSDEQFCLEFLTESLRRVPSVPLALDFGSGPIISHILPLATKAQEIHASEYVESNRKELQDWLSEQPNTHNWRPFTLEILRLEGKSNPTIADAEEREREIRQKVTRVVPGDVRETNPLGSEKRGFYPLVTAHYCAEGIDPDKQKWRIYMSNIMSMVKPGGRLITSACGSGTYYKVADTYFPSTNLEPQDVLNCFWENGFVDVDIRVRQLPEYSEQGFFYTIFACGVKENK